MSPLLQLLRWAPPIFFGLALGSVIYGMVCAPTREPPRYGLRGLKRKKALNDVDGWAQLEPFVRWLGARVGGILTDTQREKVEYEITRAGDFMGLGSDDYVALSLLGAVLGGLGGGGIAWYQDFPIGLGAMLGTLFGAIALKFHLQGVAEQRIKDIGRTLPYAIDLMALSMSAGLDFPGSARQVIEKSSSANDPLVEEFTLLSQQLNLGRTRKEALLEMARRVPAEAVKEFTNAILQAEERGNPVAEVLLIQASISRTRRSIRAEESAAAAATKLALPMVMVLLVLMGLLLAPIVVGLNNGI